MIATLVNPDVLSAARELAERAKGNGQQGRVATTEELETLSRKLGAHLPPWYRDLLAEVPLTGLELGFEDPEDAGGRSWILWLTADAIAWDFSEASTHWTEAR